MASVFTLEIVTPERSFFSGEVEMVVLRAPDGELGILKGHIPMVSAVAAGPVRILQDGKWQEAAITTGFMEIRQERTIILVDTAEWPHEIDTARAEAAKERALHRLRSEISHIEYLRSEAALARALTRLKVKKDINRT
jgi:F-type H+-transporting ATPase subunit epsilon